MIRSVTHLCDPHENEPTHPPINQHINQTATESNDGTEPNQKTNLIQSNMFNSRQTRVSLTRSLTHTHSHSHHVTHSVTQTKHKGTHQANQTTSQPIRPATNKSPINQSLDAHTYHKLQERDSAQHFVCGSNRKEDTLKHVRDQRERKETRRRS